MWPFLLSFKNCYTQAFVNSSVFLGFDFTETFWKHFAEIKKKKICHDILLCVYVHVCAWVCMHEYSHLQSFKDNMGSPGAGVIGSCDPSDLRGTSSGPLQEQYHP